MSSPPTNGEQNKDVYTHAGLSLYWAQCFEMSLTNALLLFERATNIRVTVGELESLEADLRRKTLSRLLNSAKKIITFDNETKTKIDTALEARNFLAHHFFEDRARKFLTPAGRNDMIDELKKMQDTFMVADTIVMALCGTLCEAIGISKEFLNTEYQRIHAEATRV